MLNSKRINLQHEEAAIFRVFYYSDAIVGWV
jgi:hypothetical protein